MFFLYSGGIYKNNKKKKQDIGYKDKEMTVDSFTLFMKWSDFIFFFYCHNCTPIQYVGLWMARIKINFKIHETCY